MVPSPAGQKPSFWSSFAADLRPRHVFTVLVLVALTIALSRAINLGFARTMDRHRQRGTLTPETATQLALFRRLLNACVWLMAIGIGLTLAMQCDIRLVAEDAKLGFVHVRRGVLPDAHSHWTVPRTVGFARAADLFLTGRTFTGREAAELGLASRALPSDDVLPAALDIARDIAVNTAPLSVALSKRLLWASPVLDREEVGYLETEYHRLVMGTPDAREGVLAWLERRDPRWTGKPF